MFLNRFSGSGSCFIEDVQDFKSTFKRLLSAYGSGMGMIAGNNQKYKIVGFKIIRVGIGYMVWIYGMGGISLYRKSVLYSKREMKNSTETKHYNLLRFLHLLIDSFINILRVEKNRQTCVNLL